MQCARCGHLNVSNFRFCEACLAPLSEAGSDDVVGKFFDDADLIEAGQTDASRGAAMPARFDLPWKPDTREGSAGWTHELAMAGRDACPRWSCMARTAVVARGSWFRHASGCWRGSRARASSCSPARARTGR
jgi:hypothetical protein